MATDTGFGKVRLFEDFLEDTVNADIWVLGNTQGGTAAAINTQVNGVVRLTVAANSGADGSQIYGGHLIWEANDGGPLIMEARCKPETALTMELFVGFSDEIVNEQPMDYDGDSQTTTSTNGAGFYYAGGGTTPTWRCGGVKAGSDSTHTAASSVFNPVVSTYQTFRVVLGIDGSGSFYIDGNPIVENVKNCVTTSTALTPYVAIMDDEAAGNFDVDYIYVSKGRV